ncbi:MAG: phosphatidylserine decarboxylase [Zoogloeaceae bacterium]|nr:phosphatidylserine decarboxylase [Zoogloeaceae bacterium]
MAHYPHPLIAREGWPFLSVALIVAAAVTWFCGLWSIPFWLIALFVLQFFRDPPREVTGNSKSVLSPADGRIVAIQPVRDPWLDRDALKVSVFMNVFNVHSNRSPVDGEIIQRWYHAGKFVNADLDKASEENERNALHFRCADGQDITCVQVAGLIARRILCYAEAGAKLTRGQRYGFIRFGSRVDLYLPTTAHIKVTIGDKVRATSTLLAELQ